MNHRLLAVGYMLITDNRKPITDDYEPGTWESPLINGCPITNEGFTFCGDPRAVQGFRYAGVAIVNYDYAQPRWADPATARTILAGMRDATRQLAHRR